MGVSRADNSFKISLNLPISNPKPDLHNINAHTKFGENPLKFTHVIIQKRNMDGHMTNRHSHDWDINPCPAEPGYILPLQTV